MAYPRSQRARNFKFAIRTAGSITFAANVSFQVVDTALDLVLSAQPGDVIECGLSAQGGAEAAQMALDVWTMVSAAQVNRFGGTNGVTAWKTVATAYGSVGGSVMRAMTASDLSAGTVTLRLYFSNFNAAAKTLLGTNTDQLQFWAKNLGPADST